MFIDAALAACSPNVSTGVDMLLNVLSDVASALIMCGAITFGVLRMKEYEELRRAMHQARVKAIQAGAMEIVE